MERGDISNQVVPRLCLVFEGLIGLLPPRSSKKHTVARKLGRWKQAVNYYEVNEEASKYIWDATWRYNFQVEAVTWMPVAALESVAEWIDRSQLPIGHISCSSPVVLSRSIPYRLDLAAIFDPDPANRFTYGSKGRIVDPARPVLLG